MKPSECKSIADTKNLNEQGLKFGGYEIEVRPCSVFLRINHYAEIRMPQHCFKQFAEWYLADQTKGE